jgi:acylphosphatase
LPEVPAKTAQRALVSATTGAADVRLTAWLRGRVQGVGMRWWIRSRALELGLTGWARNLDDRRVEVVAEGPEAACQALLDALRGVGPAAPPGQVDTLVERWSAAVGLGGCDGGFHER